MLKAESVIQNRGSKIAAFLSAIQKAGVFDEDT
jgi:hypothetical protein